MPDMVFNNSAAAPSRSGQCFFSAIYFRVEEFVMID